MAENKTSNNKRIIIVGIPGVGKTSVISLVNGALNHKGYQTTVAVFGTIMFEEAKKIGLKNRDELRKLSIRDQQHLQEMAAKRIAEMNDDIVIIDTHLFVKTAEGYYPGLPMTLLDIIKPTHFVIIMAEPKEIVDRRKCDTSRHRDIVSVEDVQHELDISKIMVASSSIITGSPFTIIMNKDNKINDAALKIVNVLKEEKKIIK